MSTPMTPRQAVASHLTEALRICGVEITIPAQAPALADEVIEVYQRALPQPLRDAKKDGRNILAWDSESRVWCFQCCGPENKWPRRFTMWQPMPLDWEGSGQ
jgi:hypothetical protein